MLNKQFLKKGRRGAVLEDLDKIEVPQIWIQKARYRI